MDNFAGLVRKSFAVGSHYQDKSNANRTAKDSYSVVKLR